MKNENDLSDAVISFLSEELSINKLKICNDTRIFHDLGVDGDDADELISNYSDKFNVSIKEFSFSTYFGSEASLTPASFVKHLLGKSKKTKPLFVKDFINGATKGFLSKN